ncbi:MAG TPA: capsule assembly Wzi family protein [Daejeonella sp.]|nr:capsule assembly Wzi family protein [Daejeonella sp.]
MLINTYLRYLAFSGSMLFIFTALTAKAQFVPENPQHEIYPFLYRQAQKGNISLNDLIQPISRKEIAAHLRELQKSPDRLSPVELKELAFYKLEYSEFDSVARDSLTFFKKDQAGRLRFLSLKKDGFLLNGDPSLSLNNMTGTNKQVFRKGNGLNFWGHAGSRVSFYFSFQDYTESGNGIDSLRDFTSMPGVVKTQGLNPEKLSYSELKAGLAYTWKNGSVAVGKDQFIWGYGANGRPVFSDKAPTYPYIRLDYQPLKWLSFNYTHGSLQSGIIDSAKSYHKGNSVFGTTREVFTPKFIASHSLNFYPVKGLSLSLGESMVYSDKLQIAYLVPVMFFKAFDHYQSRYNINAGSNGQFFFQASSRDHISNTHFYATLFIDEIRLTKLFSRIESRNQIGYNLGVSVTDFILPYLTIGTEYTRINPFVYQNLIPTQNFSSNDYSLGDWMGNNADRWLAFVNYTPLARLKTGLMVQKIRKGGPGTLEQQYFQQPQPKFLFDKQKENLMLRLSVNYEIINNLQIKSALLITTEESIDLPSPAKTREFQLSVSFGL